MADEGPPAAVLAAAEIAFGSRSPAPILEAAPVFTLAGARSYWLVGDRGPSGIVAFARIRDDGQALTIATLRTPAKDCAAAATNLDEAGARALASSYGSSPAILVQDGPPARDAWLIRDEPDKPLLLATGGGTYERMR